MATVKCQKFQPNIFNKNKCQHCFKPKELHSAEALEKSKVARKVSKCSYLFVAPPSFDFSSPLDRTRRWQRRFCVLYDDGEFTYSVDENIHTVPQGVIDMNVCMDVFDAEGKTGHSYSIAVQTPDSLTYIKGTGKEEIARWHDILVMYPRSIKTKSKHKRTPTYPQTSVIPKNTEASATNNASHQAESGSSSIVTKRLRYHSTSASTSSLDDIDGDNKENQQPHLADGTMDTTSERDIYSSSEGGSKAAVGGGGGGASRSRSPSEPRTAVTTSSDHPSGITYRGIRSLKHKHDKSYSDGLRKSNSWQDLSPGGSTSDMPDASLPETRPRSQSRESMDEIYTRRRPDREDSSLHSQPTQSSKSSSSAAAAVSPAASSPSQIPRQSSSLSPARTLRDPASAPRRTSPAKPASSPERTTTLFRSRSPTSSLLLNGRNKNETDERKMAKSGDFGSRVPGEVKVADDSAPKSATRPGDGLTKGDLTYMKKGWLVKQGNSDKDWTKLWFVLSGHTLQYYKDSWAEECSAVDGVIDLATCTEVREVHVSRNYGFVIKGHGGDYVLSAITSMIRNNWIQALQKCLDCNPESSALPVAANDVASGEPASHAARRSAERQNEHSASTTRAPAPPPPPSGGPRPATTAASQRSRPPDQQPSTRVPSSDSKYVPRSRYSELGLGRGTTGISSSSSSSNSSSSSRSTGTEPARMRRRRLTVDSVPHANGGSYQEGHNGAAPSADDDPSQSFVTQAHIGNLSDYLEQGEDDKRKELSTAEEQELDNVERNIRKIHRKSITEFQVHKPQHFERFESGAAFQEPEEDRAPSEDILGGHQEDSSTSAWSASSSVSSRHRHSDASRAPSAKIKEKTRCKSPRSRSPPPETLDRHENFLDSFVQRNLDQRSDEQAVSGDTMERSWKEVELHGRGDQSAAGTETSSASCGDTALVELLETEIDSMKAQLENTQSQLRDAQHANMELRTELQTTSRSDSEYLNDVEADQSRFMAQIVDLQQELEQSAEQYKSMLSEHDEKAQLSRDQIKDLKSEQSENKEVIEGQEEVLADLRAKLKMAMSQLASHETALEESAEEIRREQDHSQKISDELDQRIDELEREIKEKDKLIRKMEREGRATVEKVGELQTKLEERNDRVDGLEGELHQADALRQELSDKTEATDALTHETELLRQQLREQDEVMQRAQTDSNDKVKHIEDELYHEKEHLENTILQLQHRLEQLMKQSTMADSLNSNMADILREKDETIAHLEEKLIESEARIDELTEELNIEIDDNAKLHQNLDESVSSSGKVKTRTEDLLKELAQMKQGCVDITRERNDLSNQFNEKNTENELLTRDVARMDARVQQLERENRELKHSVDKQANGVQVSRASYAAKAAEVDDLKTLVSEASSRSERDQESMQEQLLQASSKIRSLEEELMKWKKDSQEMTSSLDARAIQQKYEEAMENVSRTNSEMASVESLYKESIDELQVEVAQKAQESEESRTQLDHLRNKHNVVVSDLGQAQNRINELEAKLESDQQQYVKELEGKLKHLRDSQSTIDELHEKLECSLVPVMEEKAEMSSSCLSESSSPLQISFSDIPSDYDELQEKYKKAMTEVKKQRRELQESQAGSEEMDSFNVSLKNQVKNMEIGYQDHMNQLSERVKDLDSKLAAAEKRNKRYERSSRTPEVPATSDREVQVEEVTCENRESKMNGITTAAAAAADLDAKLKTMVGEVEVAEKKVKDVTDLLLDQDELHMELKVVKEANTALEKKARDIQAKLEVVEASDGKTVRDSHLAPRLKDLQLKLEAARSQLADCCRKLSSVAEGKENDVSQSRMQDILSAMSDVQKSLGQPLGAASMDSEVCKMQLFAEKLALEAVILSEMAYIVKDTGSTLDSEREHFLVQLKVAQAKLSQLDCKFEARDYQASPNISGKIDSMSMYASLLAEKLVMQGQMQSLLEDARESSSDEVSRSSLPRMHDDSTQALAQSIWSKAQLDLPFSVDSSMSSQSSVDTHAAPSSSSAPTSARAMQAIAHADLTLVFNRLKHQHSGSYTEHEKAKLVDEEINSSYQRLVSHSERVQSKLAQCIESKTNSLAILTLATSAHRSCTRSESTDHVNIDCLRHELEHMTSKYCSYYSVGNGSKSSLAASVAAALQISISKILDDVHVRLMDPSTSSLLVEASQSDRDHGVTRSSIVVELADLLVQGVIVQGNLNALAEQAEGQAACLREASTRPPLPRRLSSSSSSLPLSPESVVRSSSAILAEHNFDMSSVLATDATSKFNIATFLVNNTVHDGDQVPFSSTSSTMSPNLIKEYVAQLAGKLVGLDLHTARFHSTLEDYAESISQEAFYQAQLSFVSHCLRLKYEKKLQQLKVELDSTKLTHIAQQKVDKEGHQNEIDILKELVHQKEQLLRRESLSTEDRLDEAHADLDRKENIFRQEVQALKDGYEIRIRSLQSDLEVAKDDLEKLHQEHDRELQHREEEIASLESSVKDKKDQIDCMICTQDGERGDYAVKIEELNDALHKVQQASVTAGGGGAVAGAMLDDRSTNRLQDEVTVLRQQLEEERKRHLSELEYLQQNLGHDSDAASQLQLGSKIQHLEEVIQNMQSDYEQELALQKAAHRRELARSKDDMMQLLAVAEAKSIHIDEDSIRKKYMKEIERIKDIYDRGFSSMEKSHQKLIMDMRKAHKRELDLLRKEKDQVLAEETHATQAALDAMRKAHESELQKERSKFLEIINKTYSQADVESLQRQHEEDLDLIQQEIRQVSEQFSIKCLECASLEERLEMQTRALHECRKRNQDLIARNEELTTRIKHELQKLNRMVNKPRASPRTDGDPPEVTDMKMALKVKDVEVQHLHDEIGMLQDKLQGTVEELEETMDHYHELHSEHQVAAQKHKRETEGLRRQILEHRSFDDLDEGDGNSMAVNSGLLDYTQSSEAHHDPKMTSTPRLPDDYSQDPEQDEDRDSREGSPTRSQTSASQGSAAQGRQLPSVSTQARSVKKALWRQRQPERARSNPGLVGSRLSLMKIKKQQVSFDEGLVSSSCSSSSSSSQSRSRSRSDTPNAPSASADRHISMVQLSLNKDN